MIVLDASVFLDLVVGMGKAVESAARIESEDDEFIAPHVLDLEVLQALRRQVRLELLDNARARSAVAMLGDLPLTPMSHEPLISRIWELRNNLTAYDAAYLALAEDTGAAVRTRDSKFAGAAGHRASVILI